MKIEREQRATFLEILWGYYREHGRHELPWRLPEADGSIDPYKILVSELMLQQTQVPRVIPKYHEFLRQFPDVVSLADAELGEALRAWQGLGYNRRAKFLWQSAQYIHEAGAFPNSLESLVALPGVGTNTAGAIMAYAFNAPVVFVETNIRTVIFYHFAPDAENIPDSFIREVLTELLDTEHPREFYWALMDYGAFLKTQVRNNAQSKQYTKQSAFHGSRRQVRGSVLRLLTTGPQTLENLQKIIEDERLPNVLEALLAEGLIRKDARRFFL